MKRVLIISAVLVLCLALFVVWLATGPGPRPVDDVADKGRNESPTRASGGTAPGVEQANGLAKTEAPPAQHTDATPATSTAADSGFRPITEVGAPAQRIAGEESVSSRTTSDRTASEEGPRAADTSLPKTAQSSFPEALSDAAPGDVPAEVPEIPANKGLGASAEREVRPVAPAEPDESAPVAGVVVRQPAPPEARAPRPRVETAPAPPVLAQRNREPTPVRQRPPAPPGRYETIRQATARARPSDTAPIVDRIDRGTFLNVTGSEGDWLVVYSKRKNITVFVRRDAAMLSRDQRPASTDVPESDWPRVEREILDALARNNVTGVQVTFIADTAYLKGTVATDAERERAETFARSILEVKHVLNGIRVE